jgi:aspartate/methionine/tyrosine aminotransferase
MAERHENIKLKRVNKRGRSNCSHSTLDVNIQLTCGAAEGAFYAFPCVRGAGGGESAELLTTRLLEEARVAVTPGDAFGAPGYVRISYATSLEKLKEAVTRMRAVLEGN